MKHIKKINIIHLIFALAFHSCSQDILNLEDPININSENYFDKPTQIVEAANATYGSFYYNSQMNLQWPEIFDCLANEVTPLSPVASAWPDKIALGKYQHNNTTYAIEGYWRMLYKMIMRANLTIDKGNEVLKSFPNDIRLTQAIGEAYFLRGWAYAQLAFQWGRVPIRVTFDQKGKEQMKRADTVEEVWAVAENDFKNAQKLLPNKWGDVDLGRATFGAATAFLGKLYLYNKRYSEAEVEFLKIYGKYTLLSAKNWQHNFDEINENNSESIFEVQFYFEEGDERWWMYTEGGPEGNAAPATNSWHTKAYSWVTSGWKNWAFPVVRTQNFVYNNEAGLKYIDPRASETFYGNRELGDTVYCDDYIGGPRKYKFDLYGYRYKKHLPHEYSPIVAQESGINLRLMRYADVVLMLAECKLQTNDIPASINYINEIRKRIGAIEYKKTYSKEEAFALLKRERQLEFMAEQSRFNDLKRWGILAEEMNPELREIPNSGLVEPKHYLFPIPQLELDTNLEFGEVTESWN